MEHGVNTSQSVNTGSSEPSGPRSALGIVGELAVGITVATVTSVVLQWLVNRLHWPTPTHAPTAVLSLLAVPLMAGLAALVMIRRPWSVLSRIGAWSGLSALTTLGLALPLSGTLFYYGGISVDQLFRTQYLVRMTSTSGFADMNYVDLPPFYPAGWFWLGGRFANLLGLPGWVAFKPWAILTMAVTAVIVFVLWSTVVRRRTAVLMAVATSMVGMLAGATEPYAWLIIANTPPLLVIAQRALRSALLDERGPGRRHGWGAMVGIGVFVGISGSIYTLYTGFVVVGLAVVAVTSVVEAHRAARTRPGVPRWPAALRMVLLRLIGAAAVSVPIMLLVWAPFLLKALSTGMPPGMAQRYLPPDSAVFPTPMFELSVQGLLCLAGTVWLIFAARRDQVARALLTVVLVVYAWFALSTLMLALDTSLLAFRMRGVLLVVLYCAGALAVREGWRWARGRITAQHLRTTTVAVVVFGVFGAVSIVQSVPQAHSGEINAAYYDYYPTGHNSTQNPKSPLKEDRPDPSNDGAVYDELIGSIQEMTGKKPKDLVLLTTVYPLMAFEPYWGFQMITDHYANPLAQYKERAAEMARWASAKNGDELARMLDKSKFRVPDVFVLRGNNNGGLTIQLSEDRFPRYLNTMSYEMVFPEKIFDPAHFTSKNVGPFRILVRK
ncbi:arabinofuranosyltransferase [Allokutzneria oryzae]|uniref:Galactan 5-O-arabinofuranosyltransferase n=1 Tax=Allokutzneria oryzae TaxID=1378989 RepID=A0ABV6A396_9PSEU